MSTAPNLVQDLTTRTHSDLRIPCAVGSIKRSMTPEEMSAFDKALSMIKADTGIGRAKVYSYEWLSDVLAKHGHSVSTSTLGRHARGKCGCQ